MEPFKIWTKDLTAEECAAVQKALFTLGYKWASGDTIPLYVEGKNNIAYIVTYKDNRFSAGRTDNPKPKDPAKQYRAHEYKEIMISDIIGMARIK